MVEAYEEEEVKRTLSKVTELRFRAVMNLNDLVFIEA